MTVKGADFGSLRMSPSAISRVEAQAADLKQSAQYGSAAHTCVYRFAWF